MEMKVVLFVAFQALFYYKLVSSAIFFSLSTTWMWYMWTLDVLIAEYAWLSSGKKCLCVEWSDTELVTDGFTLYYIPTKWYEHFQRRREMTTRPFYSQPQQPPWAWHPVPKPTFSTWSLFINWACYWHFVLVAPSPLNIYNSLVSTSAWSLTAHPQLPEFSHWVAKWLGSSAG